VRYAAGSFSFANIRKGGFDVKIAVTSQNRRTITEHAGKCRKFWVYDIEQSQITGKSLLELPVEQSLHESSPQESHPLDAVQVLITGSMGPGLQNRLASKGITALMTAETDPDQAVAAYLQGRLVAGAGSCDQGAHQHHHHHRHT
jgi:predicted Fe-Mo cluster-binding NifX family protein